MHDSDLKHVMLLLLWDQSFYNSVVIIGAKRGGSRDQIRCHQLKCAIMSAETQKNGFKAILYHSTAKVKLNKTTHFIC